MKVNEEFLIETAATALVNLIPVIGGSITGIWGNIQAERKNQRFQEFLQQLTRDLNDLQAKINGDYIAKNDFLDIFEQTSQKIMSQRSDLKRQVFKNNFISGIISPHVDYDNVESNEKIIDYLNEESITILITLHNPEQFKLPTNYINPIELYGVEEMVKNTFPEIADRKVNECIDLLTIQRLINTTTLSSYPNNVPIKEILREQLTVRGNDFSRYISDIIKT